MLLTITVRHDRDESCNDYTLTRRIEVNEFSANLIQMSARGIMDLWKESYPHKGRAPHTPVVDVTVEGGTSMCALIRGANEVAARTEGAFGVRTPRTDNPLTRDYTGPNPA